MKKILAIAVAAVAAECLATVYRPGLVQAKFKGSAIGFSTSVQPVLVSNLLSQTQYTCEGLDFAYGSFMANFSAGNTTAVFDNLWSGNKWGWNGDHTLFAYEGQVYLRQGQTIVATGAFDDGSAMVVNGVTLFQEGDNSGYNVVPSTYNPFTAPENGWYPVNAWVWDWSSGKAICHNYISGCQYRLDGDWSDFTNRDKWSKLVDPGNGSFLRIATGESFADFGDIRIVDGAYRFEAAFDGIPASGATLRLYYGDADAGDTKFGWKGHVDVASIAAGTTAASVYSVSSDIVDGRYARTCLCYENPSASQTVRCVDFEEWGEATDLEGLDPTYPVFRTPPTVVGTPAEPKISVDLLSGSAELKLLMRKAGGDVETSMVLAESAAGPLAQEFAIQADADCAYALRLVATSTEGSVVEFDLGTFLFAELAVTASDANEAGFVSGGLILARPDTASAKAEDLVVRYTVSGTAVAGVQYAPLSGTAVIPAGETSAVVEVKPILDILMQNDVDVAIDIAADVFFLAQSSYSVVVRNDPAAVRDPLIRYVSESGSDVNDGQTPATAFRTVSKAVVDIGADGGRVFVAPGRYEEDAALATDVEGEEKSAIVLDHGIAVMGTTGDPSDVVITRKVVKDVYARMFLLKHADARVSGVTIDNGCPRGPGGNVWITSAGGTVENCIIQNGRMDNAGGKYWWACGANVYQQGGRVSRCVIQGGYASYSAGARVEGGVMENSLIRNNTCPTTEVGGVELRNSAALVNCTVTGNRSLTISGVRAFHDSVKVVNCAIFGNESTSDASGHAHVWEGKGTCFLNCAGESAPNETCFAGPSGFEDIASGDCRLTVVSVAFDTGASYAATPAVSPVDIAGSPRISGGAVDIGCYEYQNEGSFAIGFDVFSAPRGFSPVSMEYRSNVINSSGAITYEWDINGDGVFDVTRVNDPSLVWKYDGDCFGAVDVVLRATDESGHTATRRRNELVFVSPRVLYADPDNAARARFPFATPETAGTNLAEVVALASSGCTVLLADGTYDITSELMVVRDIDIRSSSGDPAKCVIRQTRRMGWDFAFYSRVVHMNSPGAFLGGVTLRDGFGIQSNSNGCGLLIDVLGGTASNIVIKSGYACNYSAEGGGAWVRSGLLAQAEITGCDCENGKDQTVASALVVDGDGRAENCLVHGNGYVSNAGAVVAVRGNGVLANSTVVSNRVLDCEHTKDNVQRHAVCTDGSGRVVNCVVAGTECAAVADGEDVNWLGGAASFENCATDSATPINATCIAAAHDAMFRAFSSGDYRPKTGGALVNAGSDDAGLRSSVDFAGNPRVRGRHVDIGCYEGRPSNFEVKIR